MIKRKPTKTELKIVLSYKLALVVTKDYERILIGSEENIKRRLSGQPTAEVMYDKIRPFGTLLLTPYPSPKDNWETAISHLFDALEILHSINPAVHFSKENVLCHEGIAQDILTNYYDSDDPVCQFVALRIWYGYWYFRGERTDDNCKTYLSAMGNFVRPFSHSVHYIEDRHRVTASNSLFRHPQEFKYYEKEQNIYHLTGAVSTEYIIVDRSLIPLEMYYITQFNKWTKYLTSCKICGRHFFADTLKFELCSQNCRDQARKNVLDQRKSDEVTATVDRICRNADAHWNNRLRKIKSARDWSSEDIQKYETFRQNFLTNKKEMRKAYKKEEITLIEFRNWLLYQEVDAQAALETILAEKKHNTPQC